MNFLCSFLLQRAVGELDLNNLKAGRMIFLLNMKYLVENNAIAEHLHCSFVFWNLRFLVLILWRYRLHSIKLNFKNCDFL